jgi:hypothetical protein
LCWSQVAGDFTVGFTARIHGNEKNGISTGAIFNPLGGYYFEVNDTSGSPEYWAGGFSITGKLIPESKVPVPRSVQLH